MGVFLKLSVSRTHCIASATTSFSLMAKREEDVRWSEVIKIAMSWFVSSLLSGIMSVILFFLVHLP